MRKTHRPLTAAALALAACAAVPASAAVVAADRFTDGTAAGGADQPGLAWYANANNGAAGTATVTADAALPARGEANNNVLVHDPAGTFQSVVAAFSSQALGIGQSVTLTFDFRFASAPANGQAVRFGLHNHDGSPPTADGASADQTSAAGYYVSYNTGTSTGGSTFRETGGTPSILGGTDRAQIGASSSTPTNIVGTEAHTALLTLTRTAAGTIQILGQLDGVTIQNVTDTAATNFTFNEVSISGAGNGGNLHIDNVVIDSTVPEPGAVGLLALAATPLLRRRRK